MERERTLEKEVGSRAETREESPDRRNAWRLFRFLETERNVQRMEKLPGFVELQRYLSLSRFPFFLALAPHSESYFSPAQSPIISSFHCYMAWNDRKSRLQDAYILAEDPTFFLSRSCGSLVSPIVFLLTKDSRQQ